MASATKSAPKFEPPVETSLANGDAADAYEPVDAPKVETEAVAEPKVETGPVIRGHIIGRDTLEYADPKCRPPGEIAEQTTSATGNWVRVRYAVGTPGSWRKTNATDQKVFSASRKHKTAAEAVSALVAL
jgi:hypothetical protein